MSDGAEALKLFLMAVPGLLILALVCARIMDVRRRRRD
jgi:hypothetical protein